MAESHHRDKSQQLTQNQNNRMSEDSGDGSRSDRVGADNQDKPIAIAPEEKAPHDQEVLEAFGEEGAGIAAKE